MKLKMAIAGFLLSMSGFVQAALITENIELGFESGATFVGTIVVSDDYSFISSVNGLLSGGSQNYNHIFDIIWWGYSYDYNTDGDLNDWFYGQNYIDYIGLSWFKAESIDNGSLTLNLNAQTYHNGLISSNDRIVSQTFSSMQVPEPSTLAILMLGLIGFGVRSLKSKIINT